MKFLFALSTLFLMFPMTSQALEVADPAGIRLDFPNSGVYALATWVQGPHTGQESQMLLEWYSAEGNVRAEVPGTFNVVLWMPSMGHGSAPTKIHQATQSDGTTILGGYLIQNMQFVMGGDWDVQVQLNSVDGKQDVQIIKLNLEGGGHGHSH